MSILEAEIKDIVTLSDGNEYTVTSKINYEEKTYFCFVNKNMQDMMFGVEKNGEVVELQDGNLIQKLLPLFMEETKKHIND